MKFLCKIMLCIVLLGVVTACQKDEMSQDNTMLVTPGTLDGNWQLTEWNGETLKEGMYVYLTFERKERTFTMYEKMGSMYAHKSTGKFSILEDEDLGTILTGEYDYDNGSWKEYVVLSMDASTMVLALKSDMTDVSVYTRCAKVPEDVINGSRSLTD